MEIPEIITIAEAVKLIDSVMDFVLHACQTWRSGYMITDDHDQQYSLQSEKPATVTQVR